MIPKFISQKQLALLAISIAIPNFLQVHFFNRDENGTILVDPGFSLGVIRQEREKRQIQEYLRTDFLEKGKSELQNMDAMRLHFLQAVSR